MPENCPDKKVLEYLLAGALSPEQEQTVSRHLDRCPMCRERLEQTATGDRSVSHVARLLRDSRGLPESMKRVIDECTSDPEITAGPAMLCPESAFSDLQDLASVGGVSRISNRSHHDDTKHAGIRGNEVVESSLVPGSPLGDYELLEKIGRGGTGEVWRARDPLQDRNVAIKVLDPRILGDSIARQRFLREARAVFAVDHPNVVKMYWVEESPVPHLVMEYVDGPSLRSHLSRRGALDLPTVLRIGSHVARGLAASHERGVIHRDIKPGNIVLNMATGQAKLTDFGLARIEGDSRLTFNGYVAGTPAYMSPEQAMGEEVDFRSDLFSLGSVLYTMATGQSPFDDEKTFEALDRVCTTEPVSPQTINPGISRGLADLIRRLHAKRPEDRPRSARDVADLLERQLAELLLRGQAHRFPEAGAATEWDDSDKRSSVVEYLTTRDLSPRAADRQISTTAFYPSRRKQKSRRVYLAVLVVAGLAILGCVGAVLSGRF